MVRQQTLETAIPIDLEEPLLPPTEKGTTCEGPVVLEEKIVQGVHNYVQLMGWTLGFLLQCLSLGSTAAMTLMWQEEGPPEVDNSSTATRFAYWMFFGLSNSWLVLFPMVCVAIERSWKSVGVVALQETLIISSEEPVVTLQTRRMTFVAAVRFLVGIVLGCFMTWGLVDLYMGASASVLATLSASMILCLVLCRGMIYIFDSFSEVI